jgi:hypothetical protein
MEQSGSSPSSPTTEEILGSTEPPGLPDFGPGREYDKEGRPISFDEWGRLHRVIEYCRVADDTLGPYWVSTVWIGLNHCWDPDLPPLIFESMVFKGDWSDLNCARYSTLEQALEGHARMVEEVRLFAELDE